MNLIKWVTKRKEWVHLGKDPDHILDTKKNPKFSNVLPLLGGLASNALSKSPNNFYPSIDNKLQLSCKVLTETFNLHL